MDLRDQLQTTLGTADTLERELGGKGDRANAAVYYSEFVELWKHADPELQPQVADVKKRLAHLKDTEGQP